MTSLVAQTVRHLPTMRETWVGSLGREDPLEKEMATLSSTLAWKIPWMEELGGLQSMGLQRVGHNWATSLSFFNLSKNYEEGMEPFSNGRQNFYLPLALFKEAIIGCVLEKETLERKISDHRHWKQGRTCPHGGTVLAFRTGCTGQVRRAGFRCQWCPGYHSSWFFETRVTNHPCLPRPRGSQHVELSALKSGQPSASWEA